MEAASVPRTSLRQSKAAVAIRRFLGRYGLILVLLVLPVVYGIQDLRDDGNLAHLGQNLKDGLSNGAIWALIALGYTLVYGIIELINFAHGDVFMIGSFVAVGLYGTFGLTQSTGTIGLAAGLLVVMLLSMFICGALNTMIERVAYRPLRNAPKLAPLITAVGFSFILQNVGLLWNGGSQQSAADLVNAQHQLVNVFGVSIKNGDVLSLAASIPILLVLAWFVRTSRIGKAMRATAQDPEASRL